MLTMAKWDCFSTSKSCYCIIKPQQYGYSKAGLGSIPVQFRKKLNFSLIPELTELKLSKAAVRLKQRWHFLSDHNDFFFWVKYYDCLKVVVSDIAWWYNAVCSSRYLVDVSQLTVYVLTKLPQQTDGTLVEHVHTEEQGEQAFTERYVLWREGGKGSRREWVSERLREGVREIKREGVNEWGKERKKRHNHFPFY